MRISSSSILLLLAEECEVGLWDIKLEFSFAFLKNIIYYLSKQVNKNIKDDLKLSISKKKGYKDPSDSERDWTFFDHIATEFGVVTYYMRQPFCCGVYYNIEAIQPRRWGHHRRRRAPASISSRSSSTMNRRRRWWPCWESAHNLSLFLAAFLNSLFSNSALHKISKKRFSWRRLLYSECYVEEEDWWGEYILYTMLFHLEERPF